MPSHKPAEQNTRHAATPELAAAIWNDVCTYIGGWCNDAVVFLAWDAMGRPSEREYMDPMYLSERDPQRRRFIIANARISAMAQLVADDLISVVEEAPGQLRERHTGQYVCRINRKETQQ